MKLEEIKKSKKQLYQIAVKYGISKIYVFGSVARGESKDDSDIDFLIEMDENVSAMGVGAFQYESQQLYLRLFSQRGYSLCELALIDMFPETYHMEVVGLL